MPEYTDYPIKMIAEGMEQQRKRGAVTFQKWTCSGCGERVTSNVPDTVYRAARHEDREDGTQCGAITDIEKQGCNFLFIMATGLIGPVTDERA